MGHPSKTHHLTHQWQKETQCALRRTLMRTSSMTWLRGDLQPECYISLTKPLSTLFPNNRTKWSRQPTVRNSWLLDKQLNRSSIYNTHSVCLVCLLKGHLGCSVTIKPLPQVPRSHIHRSTNAGTQSLITKYERLLLEDLFVLSTFRLIKILLTY